MAKHPIRNPIRSWLLWAVGASVLLVLGAGTALGWVRLDDADPAGDSPPVVESPDPAESPSPTHQPGLDGPTPSARPPGSDYGDTPVSSSPDTAPPPPPDTPPPADGIDSFEECAAAGYPIAESYPEQCFTPDGRGFTRTFEDSGIQGTVLFSPVCPVERFPPEPGCAPRPGPAEVRLMNAQGGLVGSAEAGEDGRFTILAPPGAYTLTGASGRPVGGCSSIELEILPERILEVTLDCDTGIR